MSQKKKRQSNEPPPIVITLTLPTPQGGGIAPERATATLLIQRGDLAQMRRFYYNGYLPDVMIAIREATEALGVLEDNPPVVPDAPKKARRKHESTEDDIAQEDSEPTIDIPLKKGVKAVKISHLKIVSGETDAASYRLAVQIAAKLIGGGLWNGKTPIRIHDAHATLKQMAHLTDKEMSLFTLADFVETE